MNYQQLARLVVLQYIRAQAGDTEEPLGLTIDSIFVVLFSKNIQNWMAIVVTELPDKKIYEVVYNGDNDELYIAAFEKVDNKTVPNFSVLAAGVLNTAA